MRLPKDLFNNYVKPKFYLCETDKEKICELQVSNSSGSFKFNSLSEISFEVGRTYNNQFTGKNELNPHYDLIESPRLIYVDGFGYFELQAPEIHSDGIKESKSCTANSYEYILSTKYLEDFYINTGKVDSIEVLEANGGPIVPVCLYDPFNPKLSLLHLVLEKTGGLWKIGHVDDALKTLRRQFEVDRQSIYDFLMSEVCEKFNCYIVFDTINNTVNLYAESLTSKFTGDGETNIFTISPPFSQIGSVSVDGYKTTRWTYNASTGALTLQDIPESGAYIEVVDGALTEWETDVFITFENLSSEMNINYNADEIKTVLTVTYGDNGNIRETNLGLPYLTDISYYCTPEWMGQSLYDAYIKYQQKCNRYQTQYADNSQKMLDIAGLIDFETNRLSLEYSRANSVNASTQGTYYVRGGSAPNYYYTEVSLPADYNANTVYYRLDTTDLNEDKVNNLLSALIKYFNNEENWQDHFNKLSTDFAFMTTYTLSYLVDNLKTASTTSQKDKIINNFLGEMWNQIGKTPLKSLYYESYKKVQVTNIEAGWSQKDHDNYWHYYPVVLVLNSIESAISKRNTTIKEYEQQYATIQQQNIKISNELVMDKNFTPQQLMRLNAFLREDELHIDDIVETDQDSIADSFKIKQDAMETGRIELQKLCQPKLQFSMSMANIYAIPEFEPIINQFQLGRVIRVGLRSDYIKQSRLLQVDLNFEDFSDFSCEFGELTDLRTQSDIHADLLSQAISAGKSVATNSHYWTDGSNKVNSIDQRLQEGLLNSIEALKSMDGTQNAYMDKYGIHLEVMNPDTGEIGDKRVWLVNNQIVFTDDGFKTSKSVLGEYVIDGVAYWGLLAQAVIAGYIEGSQIVGGTIKIGLQENGNYAFEVREDGSVSMNGGNTISGYATSDELGNVDDKVDKANENLSNLEDEFDLFGNDLNAIKKVSPIISSTTPSSATEGQIWLNTALDPPTMMIYNGGKWLYFDQTKGERVYVSKPKEYQAGDIWILATGETYKASNGTTYAAGSILKANSSLQWVDAIPTMTKTINDVEQYFNFDKNTGLRIGQHDNEFYVNISSQEMGFYHKDAKVVHISNRSANIDNLTVDQNFEVNCSATFNGSTTMEKTIGSKTHKFIWKIEESNGSLSLAISD